MGESQFPHFPLFDQEVNTFLLSCKQRGRVLVPFLVPVITIRIGEFRVTTAFRVRSVTNRQISTCTEGWPEVHRVENGAVLVNQVHFLLEGKREQKGITSYISVKSICSGFPGNRSVTSYGLVEFGSDDYQGVALAITFSVKFSN